jgi:hypothetical protein
VRGKFHLLKSPKRSKSPNSRKSLLKKREENSRRDPKRKLTFLKV